MAQEKRQLGLAAMKWAIERSHSAQESGDEESFFASVAESAWWITMLDETLWKTTDERGPYQDFRDSSPDGSLLGGLRYARNRQVHDVEVTGMQGNPLLTRRNNEAGGGWFWRALDAPGVPIYKRQNGRWGKIQEDSYRKDLADHPILDTLGRAAHFLELWVGQYDS